MITDIDVREALPQIRVPTLLMHRTGDRAVDVEASRYAAGRIPRGQNGRAPGWRQPAVRRRHRGGRRRDRGVPHRSRTPPMPDRVLARSSGILFAAGFVLFLPQFFTPPAVRIAHGVLVAAGSIWLAGALAAKAAPAQW